MEVPKHIIIPAVITPSEMLGNEYLNLISKSDAASAPDHAPVPGSGMATNRNSPNALYLIILALFASVLLSSFSAILRSSFVFLSHAIIGLENQRINGIGNKFPITAIMYVVKVSSPKAAPTGIAPLSSISGNIEINAT
jgi:hypothetical protein